MSGETSPLPEGRADGRAGTLTVDLIARMWRDHVACNWLSDGINVRWTCGIIHPGPIHMQPTTRDRHLAALIVTQVGAEITMAVADAQRRADLLIAAERERRCDGCGHDEWHHQGHGCYWVGPQTGHRRPGCSCTGWLEPGTPAPVVGGTGGEAMSGCPMCVEGRWVDECPHAAPAVPVGVPERPCRLHDDVSSGEWCAEHGRRWPCYVPAVPVVHPEPGDAPGWMDEAFHAVLRLNLPTPGWEVQQALIAAAPVIQAAAVAAVRADLAGQVLSLRHYGAVGDATFNDGLERAAALIRGRS